MRYLVVLAAALLSSACFDTGGGGGGGGDPVVPGADPSFGDGGLATVNFGGGLAGLMAVARQPDGKIVGLGGGREAIAVMRVNADGSLDGSFGEGGIVQLPWGVPTNGVDKSHGIAIQSDGKILITTRILGVYGSLGSRPFIARLESDGDLDPTFAGTGYFLSNPYTDLRSLALQPDGKILAGGSGRLERFNSDGTRDTGFGTDGIALTGVLAQDIALQADGKIVTAGGRDLARFTSTGALDLAFAGSSGRITLASTDDILYSVAIQADGKILGGGTRDMGGNYPGFAITRWDANGILDTAFGTGGIAHDNNLPEGGSQAFGIGIAPDGKIVGTGFVNVDGVNPGRSARFNADGTIDTTFGASGAGAMQNLVAFAEPVFEPDGSITTAGAWFGTGSFRPEFARTAPDGQSDSSFGEGGTIGYEVGGSFDRAMNLALQSDGSVIVAGWAADGAGPGMLRLDPDGAHDTTFGGTGFLAPISDSDLAYASSTVVQADDKIVFTGLTYRDGFSIVRLDAAGMPDATWGTEGVVRAEPIAGMRAVSRAIAEGPDGSLYIVGDTATAAGNTSEFAVVKLSADGVRDTSYTGLTSYGAGVNVPTNLVVEPSGAVVTLGFTTAITLVRFDPAGGVDPAFQATTIPFSADTRDPFNLLRQDDGKLVGVLGNFATGSLTLARWETSGALDATFGTAGTITFHLAGGSDYYYLQSPMGAAVLDDGRITVGLAESSGDALQEHGVLVRVNPDGSPDESLGPGGVANLADLGVASSALHAMLVQPNGKLLIAGRVWTQTGSSDFSVLRMNEPE